MTVLSRLRPSTAAGARFLRLEAPATWVDAAPGLMSFAVVLVVGLSGGGFFPRTWRLALLALLAASAAALIARERMAVGRREWLVVAALTGLAGWTALSAFWSSLSTDSRVEAERTLLYVIAVLAVVVSTSRPSLPALLIGGLAGITGVCAWALTEYVFSPPPLDFFQGSHLFEPFGYANAIGIYTTLGIVLAVGLSFWMRSWAGRVAVLSPLLILVPTLYYTSSRGAWVALPVGVVAILYVGRRAPRGVLIALLAAGVAVGLAIGSVRGQGFTLLGQYRPTYWRIALDDAHAHPVLGSGAGTFGRFLLEQQSTPYYAHDAHSLYLESLAELGPLGLALVVVALGAPLLALRGRHDPLVAAAAGGYVAFILHAGVDWDWEFPAVTLVGLLCGAAILVATRPRESAAISSRTRGMIVGAMVVILVFTVERLRSTGRLG